MSRFINADGLQINVDSIKTYWEDPNGILHIEFGVDEVRTICPKTASYVLHQLCGSNHIVQIIPAPTDMLLKYKNDDGSITSWKPLCLALTQNGEIRITDIDADGVVDFADSASNFEGIELEGGSQ